MRQFYRIFRFILRFRSESRADLNTAKSSAESTTSERRLLAGGNGPPNTRGVAKSTEKVKNVATVDLHQGAGATRTWSGGLELGAGDCSTGSILTTTSGSLGFMRRTSWSRLANKSFHSSPYRRSAVSTSPALCASKRYSQSRQSNRYRCFLPTQRRRRYWH